MPPVDPFHTTSLAKSSERLSRSLGMPDSAKTSSATRLDVAGTGNRPLCHERTRFG